MFNRRQMLTAAGAATLGVISSSGNASAQTKRKVRTLGHFTDFAHYRRS